MDQQQLSRIQINFTGAVVIITCAFLLWQYVNGGVPNHHLLHRADLPAISNWWGLVVLPALTWLLLMRINKRVLEQHQQKSEQESKQETDKSPSNIVTSLVVAMIYGGVMSSFFVFGKQELTGIMFQGIFVLALFFRLYREEFVLGFILSMSFAFGAVLPTIFACVIGLAAFILYHLPRFIYATISSRLMGNKQS
ncbi:MAG: hypothetical protein OQK09_02830 [Colwellia sp.]|nr:hypothetical protein [Colwellia sp.]MCW8864884.1 hypothetical protein [Colwellia sp.]MCW9080420.1 hypothetical protein [Colwellia sp.]